MSPKGFHNILVPLDGSEHAEQAVSVGASIARRSGGTLRLASVEEPLPALVLASESPEVAREVELEAEGNLIEYLDSIADAVQHVQGVMVETALLQGPIADALGTYSEANAIDLVVMTTRGRGGVSRWLTGSVADQLLRRTTVPVLLLHPRELPQPTEFHRILIALDGDIEDPVLNPALALGSLDPAAHYTLARVVEPGIAIATPLAPYPSPLEPMRIEQLEAAARGYLTRVCEQLRERGIEATYKVVVGWGIARQVLEFATALGADCIAVGTHGFTGAERVVRGSEADRIMRRAEVPVLIGPERRP